jgi:hypothetical protein
MNYLIHATSVHPSLCLQYLFLLFTTVTITAVILLLLLLFHYYHHYKSIATDKPLRARLVLGAAELTTHLLRLTYILWLPLCRINKFGFYFPRRLLRSPILVGHQPSMASTSCGRPTPSRIPPPDEPDDQYDIVKQEADDATEDVAPAGRRRPAPGVLGSPSCRVR